MTAPSPPPALTDAAESETSERSLRALVTCVGGSHTHPSREVAFACALLNERERRREESASDRSYIRDLESAVAQAERDAVALRMAWLSGAASPGAAVHARIDSYAAKHGKETSDG